MRHSQSPSSNQQAGFTLIELMVVIVVIAILFALSTVNLGRPQAVVSLQTTVDTLIADLKSQQLLAMTGDSGSTATQQPHGVRIDSSSYDLFADSSYSTSDPNNFNVAAGDSVALSSTFPAGQVVFDTGDGAVTGFVPGSDTITVSGRGVSKIITIDRFGAISTN